MAKKRNRKVYTNGEHPDIEGVFTPDGYKSQALDVITKRQEDEPAARLMAPPDYVFPAEDSTLQIITARIGGNNVISQVMQIDKRAFRVLWSRSQEETAEINKEQKTALQTALDWQLAKLKPNIDIHEDGTANTLTRIGVFFGVLGQLIDSRAFPARSTVDEFLESAVSFLYEKDDLWFWIGRWQDIARAGRELVKERKPKSDILDKISLVDSTSSANFQKWLGVRGVFHGLENMQWADEILKEEEQILGRKLTQEDKISALMRAKEYLMPAPDGSGEVLAVSDRWGDFVISTTLPIFADTQNENERRRLEDRLNNRDLFDDEETVNRLNAELAKIVLYQNAAKVYRMSIHYYSVTKTEHLVIPKAEALEFFGKDPEDKGAYSEIKAAAAAIYNSSVIVRGARFRGVQRFWSKFFEDHKNFYIDFIPDVVPATRELVQSYGKEMTAEGMETLRSRRYSAYPPRIESAGLSAVGEYYCQFILRETGNAKIKDVPAGQKVIARTGADHCAEANIQDTNPDRRKKAMISTWNEIQNKTNIIARIEPTTRTLETLTPGRFNKTQIHVYAITDADAINQYLKERQEKSTAKRTKSTAKRTKNAKKYGETYKPFPQTL